MSGDQDESDKSYEPTPQKLQKAREKGEVAKSTDLSVAAAYAGLLLAALAIGTQTVSQFGATLVVFLDQPDELAPLVFSGLMQAPFGGLFQNLFSALGPWFAIPAAAVLLSILAQRAFVFAPSKLALKASRISIVSNAKNKFGRSGLFEFFKSFVKLLLYSICLGVFLNYKLPEIVGSISTSPRVAIVLMVRLCIEFMFLTLLIATVLGGIDAVWQHQEHLRKNRMSRKELTDETKEAEGDPYIKQQRRARAQSVATQQMIAEVPKADVVIVNPTHYAVALKWSRLPGSAPECVAKGVDEVAATIRETAQAAGVPIRHDPPTARALFATVQIGQQIDQEHYAPVAAAIRFAEDMRLRAKGKI